MVDFAGISADALEDNDRRHRRPITIFLIAFLILPGTVQSAEQSNEDASRAKLQAVELDIEKSRHANDLLAKKAQALDAEIAGLQDASIAAARIAKQNESDLTVLQTSTKSLQAELRRKEVKLKAGQTRQAKLLAALQRIAVQPPAALAFAPGTPVDSLRTAMLLGAIMPHLKTEATALSMQIAALQQDRDALAAKQAEAAERQTALAAQQENLVDLEARKKALEVSTRQQAASEQHRLAGLSGQAADLRDLLQKLQAEKQKRADEEAARQRRLADEAAARAREAATAANTPAVQAASVLPARSSFGVPPERKHIRNFVPGHEMLERPAEGRVIRRFGQSDGYQTAKGMTIATRPGAIVVAPFDGQILFAGPFRGYGQILIIEHPGGYDSLLAGCDHTDGVVGQWVMAGEPVGRMKSSADSPNLYYELRRKDQPVDPSAWMSQ